MRAWIVWPVANLGSEPIRPRRCVTEAGCWHLEITRHSLPGCAARVARLREDADDRHHAAVLVVEDMAVVDEITDIGAAEIHSHFYAGIRPGP